MQRLTLLSTLAICSAMCWGVEHAYTNTPSMNNSMPTYACIKHIVDNEYAISDDYFCLYHGMDKSIFIDLLANTYLDHFINGTPLADDFIKLRTDADLYHGEEDIAEYLRSIDMSRMSHLLFVNLSLPGCIHNKACDTLAYFNDDMGGGCIEGRIIPHYIQNLDVRDRVRQCMQDIKHSVNSYRCGVVLQVCIPQTHIDTCSYLSKPLGVPQQIRGRFPHMSHILHMYRHNMDQLKSYGDPKDLFACIWLKDSLFSSPGDIKIYAYHSFPRDIYTQLYNKLSHAVYADVN